MSASEPVRLRYYELEAFQRRVRRFQWSALVVCAVVACLALVVALFAIAKPIPVVAFDAAGRPILFEDTLSPRRKLEQVRVEAFTTDFLERFVGVDSANLDRDLAKALNMMTPRLQEIVVKDADEMRRRVQYQDANVRSRFVSLQTKTSPYDPEDGSVRVYLIAWGEIAYEPREGLVDDAEQRRLWFFSQLALQRVAVTRQDIHGVKVDYVNTRFFETEEQLRLFSLKRQPSAAQPR
jgi:hypothetical protein